jgi:hypothetical protein
VNKFDKFFDAPEFKKYPFKWNRKKRWYIWNFIIVPKKIARYEKNKKTAQILFQNQERYMQSASRGNITHASVPTDVLKIIRLGAIEKMKDSKIIFGEHLPPDINTLPKEEQDFYKKYGKSYKINK